MESTNNEEVVGHADEMVQFYDDDDEIKLTCLSDIITTIIRHAS